MLRAALRVGLLHVFGPPPFDPRVDPGDPGLFGPGSVSWAVIGEPSAIVGGLRALLVQLLHPLAMAGMADHSRYRDDPLGRLRRTSGYVTTTTFGSRRQALTAARAVRRVHRSVVGTAPDGRPYRADDPHLLGWVSVALTSSFLAAHAAYAPHPLDPSAADAFVAEQSRAAALLDPRVDLDTLTDATPLPMVDDATLPHDVAELRARLRAYRPGLEVNTQGRAALRFLLWPSLDPLVRAAYLPMVSGAVATVDPDLRRLLGVPVGRIPAAALVAHTRALLALWRAGTGTSSVVRLAGDRARRPVGAA